MTHQATLRFYAELTDFLPRNLRSGTVTRHFDVAGSVKDLIEACGIPHTEVDLIVANGRSVDFSYLVSDGDRISVFPVFESFDITPIVKVRPDPLRMVRFVADNHLGRLASFLRLLGLDTLYQRDWTDPELVRISTSQQRILLTRDVGLLKHGSVTHGYYVRAADPREQVTEVVRRFHLARHLTPFSRCMACNGELIPVAKKDIVHRLPPETSRHVDNFRVCSSCDKVYWQGAHHPELRRIVAAARRADRITK
ncbi:MAG: Mut7-C ubiquitin/RNAse domain-containing protein [Acidobacteria bacterium]|nr:Mut7-C ubiquitin/RNAse domain-containing protein [Acidobacteriota bacterium]